MKKFYALSFLTVAVMFAGGCIFAGGSGNTSAVYDLVPPHNAPEQNLFQVMAFSNNTAARTKMLYRSDPNRIVQDPSNYWVQTPELMLKRYYSLAFPLRSNVPADNLVEMRGTVTAFEMDIKCAEAVLAFNYVLRKNNQRESGTISVREKLPVLTPAGFADAMSKAADKAGQQLWLAVEKFSKKQ